MKYYIPSTIYPLLFRLQSKKKKTIPLIFQISRSTKLTISISGFIENPLLLTSLSHMIQTIHMNIKLWLSDTLANRLINYPLNNDDKNEEYKTIKHILCNNRYNPIQLDNITTSINNKTHSQHQSQTTQKNKMGHIHLHWPTNKIHHKNLQEHQSQRLLTKPEIQYKNY